MDFRLKKMEGYLKENGKMILNMDLDLKDFLQIVFILESILMGNLKVMASFIGLMEKFMRDNGQMD